MFPNSRQNSTASQMSALSEEVRKISRDIRKASSVHSREMTPVLDNRFINGDNGTTLDELMGTVANRRSNLKNISSSIYNALPTYPRTAKEKWDYAGAFTTLVSTIPQGLFAALLMDAIWLKWTKDPNSALIADAGIFTAALIGKYALMRFYNTEDFKKMADFDWKYLVSKEFWQPTNIVNQVFGLIGSGVFAGLSRLSLMGTGDLAKEYHTALGNSIADICYFSPLQVFFVVANMGSNMLFFPSMNKVSLSLFVDLMRRTVDMINDPEEHQKHLKELAQFYAAYNPLVENFTQLIELLKEAEPDAGKVDKICQEIMGNFGKILNTTGIEEGRDDAAKDILLNYLESLISKNDANWTLESSVDLNKENLANIVLAQEPTVARELAATALTLGLTSACIAGLTNFWDVTIDLSKSISLGPIAPALAFIDMLEMSAMSFISTIGYREMMSGLLQPSLSQKDIHWLRKNSFYAVLGVSAAICILGGMPNAYQSLAIAKQAISFVILSLVASCIIESSGVKAMFQGRYERPVKERLLAGHQRELVEQMSFVLAEIKQKAPKPRELPPISTNWCSWGGNRRASSVSITHATNPLQEPIFTRSHSQ